MDMRKHSFLVALVSLALVIAPLRTVLALPMSVNSADDSAHCSHMSGADPAGVTQDDVRDGPRAHGCEQGCSGACCDGACAHCVHLSIAIPGIHAAMLPADDAIPVLPDLHHRPGRTSHPPFRPPIVTS
jgi:hypothetical protein